MELDRLQVVLRSRSPWEAMDLGLTMARVWRRPLWVAWLVTVLPPFALIWLALWDRPFMAFVVCWWLKPIWDHGPLHVISRALFGGTTDLRETLASFASLSWRDLPGKLIFRRLAPWRTLVAPVTQLEGLSGSAARRRRAVLGRGLGSHALWLAGLGLLLEVVVAAGVIGTVMMVLPDEPRFTMDVLVDDLVEGQSPFWIQLLLPIVAFTSMSVVEPLVVAAAFGLYINRRTLLEGWDVELVFRRLAGRLTPIARSVGALGLVGALVGSLSARADLPTDDQVDTTLEEVLADPIFGEPAIETRWKLRDFDFELGDWFEFSSQTPVEGLLGIGTILEVMLWVLFGALIVGAVLAIVTRLGRRDLGAPRGPVRLGAVQGDPGGPARPTALADPPAVARTLWAAGQHDQALAVLYSAAVVWLVDDVGVLVPEGATEGEVLRLARRTLSAEPLAVFGRLTRAWQQIAYAHRAVDRAAFDQLCAAWPTLLRGAP